MPEVIHITMIRDNLDNIRQHTLPEGFSIRKFKRGEGPIWAAIGFAAGNFDSLEAARDRFDKEFLEPVEDMEDRCFFVIDNATDRPVGTAMAWYDPDFPRSSGGPPSPPERSGCSGRPPSRPEPYGRVHWVAIIPEFQGKGLAKPLMTAVLNRLAESHTKAVLGTQTFRKTAVRLYLNFGFLPYFDRGTCPQAWKDLAEVLNHPALALYAQE